MSKVELTSITPEQTIIEQGDEADFMYFLKDGELMVKVTDENQSEQIVNILYPGAVLGEIALISNCQRTATCEALNYVTLGVLDQIFFQEMIRLFPEVAKKIKEKWASYNDNWKQFLRRLVMEVDYFKDLPFQIVEELIYLMKVKTFNEKETFIKARDPIERIYFVSEGEIAINLTLDDGSDV